MSSLPILICYFVVYGINALVFVPISCYYCYQLWKVHKEPILKVRYPQLVFLLVILYAVYTLVFRLLADLPAHSSIVYGSTKSTSYIRLFLYNTSHIWYAVAFYRIWLLYYDYNRGLQLINQHWQSRVLGDNQAIARQTSLLSTHNYLSYRRGKAYWLCLAWWIFVEISILIAATVSQHDVTAIRWTQVVIRSIYAVLCVILAVKVRRCLDRCFFLAEAKLLGMMAAILVLLLSVFTSFRYIKHPKNDQIYPEIGNLLTFANYVVCNFAMILIMTKWVLIQYEKVQRNDSKSLPLMTQPAVDLVDILKNQDAFDLFAVHLVKELSIENLLFLFEVTQFKLQCIEHGLIQRDDIGLVLDFGDKIHCVMRINSQIDDIQSFWYNFQSILTRYIEHDGEYCVNINSDSRRRLLKCKREDLFSSHEPNWTTAIEFVKLLDAAMNQIVSLLRLDSFFRFAQTKDFKELNL